MNNDPDTGRVDIDFDPSQTRISGTTRHGNHRFDVPLISHIEENLYQGGCPEDLVLPDFIENLVSLYADAAYIPTHPLASNLRVPFHDTLDVDLSQIDSIARWVNDRALLGPTLVNCQLGLNRSALVVARALMLRGYSSGDAIALIRAQRSNVCLCNPYFESWLRALDS